VVARPCEDSWELSFSGVVCVAPLRLGGLRGKKSTPNNGSEVPVRSHRLESRSWIERAWDNAYNASHWLRYTCVNFVLEK
jgi:hypothetical protein